ncbi:hypothetical protein [Natrinema sp. DC36]|uniref:hypothetical protein n=1 Tax=Natrinema sp. DC36 TaxID=2878680 RepID=UPI001CF01556|nr:hypothetical protein [Natrinema sp. DC36]
MAVIYEDTEIEIEEMVDSQSDKYDETIQGVFDPSVFRQLIENRTIGNDDLRDIWVGKFGDEKANDERIKDFWKTYWQFLLKHRNGFTPYTCAALNAQIPVLQLNPYTPTPLFETEPGTEMVTTDTFGEDNRPVLQYSDQFEAILNHTGKTLVLQHALTEGEICGRGTDLVSETIQQQVINTVTKGARVHTKSERSLSWMPISRRNPLDGVLYLMYSRENLTQTSKDLKEDVPRYIGICRRDKNGTGKLNHDLAKITNKSRMARWGYGENQHLGALSQACFADPDQNAKEKYQKWSHALFEDGERRLSEPIFVEVLPWFDVDVTISEENLIHMASYIYGSKLLNSEHAIYKPKSFSL